MGVEHFVASLTNYHIRLIMQEVALFARFASQGLIPCREDTIYDVSFLKGWEGRSFFHLLIEALNVQHWHSFC